MNREWRLLLLQSLKQLFMKRFTRSVGFALNGIRCCFTGEAHFKIHTLSALLATGAAFFLKVSRTEWLMLLVCMAAVFTAELINTAFEELCNIVYREQHVGIKKAKDMAAAAVLVAAITAAITGSVIFIPKIHEILFG